MKKRSAIIVAIVFMMIGFAAVSTSLIINGNTKVSENIDDFSVIFTKASLDGDDVYSTAVDDTKKAITFTSKDLMKVGDSSTLRYEVTNNSNNYDAEIKVTCVPKGGTTAKYTSIKNKLEGNATIVKAKESINGNLTITLNKTSLEEVSEEYTCKLEFNAVERTEAGIEKVYTEKLLNGTDPVLSDNLIPVTIKDNGEVTYADITKEWYSYEDKVWANAVILEDGANYNVGDTIQESDIQSYFVWIPRYRYKLFNVDNTSKDSKTYTIYTDVPSKAQEIEIVFENKETKESIGTKNGDYLTHPAFTSFESNGMWVGKFETGYKGATSTSAAQVNSNDISKVIIKPNVYSWRNINVKNIFETSYNYLRDNDSHMMKNTEWGAVAYLSHSKYGINNEVRINNNSAYITGYAKTEQPTCGWTGTNEECNKYESTSLNKDGTYTKRYNTEIGYLASTTGNITGIYDMSGGAREYVAAYMAGKLGSGGITPTDYDSKYFNVYNASSTITSYQYRILGDATGEMGVFTILKSSGSDGDKTSYVSSWYTSSANFVDSSIPWFVRGGHYAYGVLTGTFDFLRYTGTTYGYIGFRLVLTPQ